MYAAVAIDRDREGDRPTADLTVLDVVLPSDRRVHEDLERFPTVGTHDQVGVHA